ncbi:transcription factor MafB [Caerostris darwini]|uniref:Transcription factor MafB n=1 Tax=Caerostris darwini TaxID=1538125 RepID=A0AAV4TR04_9ARAC|nr:transcription factor MafB [Caerostris darwini]
MSARDVVRPAIGRGACSPRAASADESLRRESLPAPTVSDTASTTEGVWGPPDPAGPPYYAAMEDHGVDYVHEFDLEHLEEVVKQEMHRAKYPAALNPCSNGMAVGQPPQQPHLVEPQHHPNGGYGMNVGGPCPRKPPVATTPPDTPPCHMPPSPAFVATSGPIIDDGMLWLTQNLRYGGANGANQDGPLDLRPPQCAADMEAWLIAGGGRRDYPEVQGVPPSQPQQQRGGVPPGHHPGQQLEHHPHHHLMGANSNSSSSSSCSSVGSSACQRGGQGGDILDDDQLISLTVRELNKRLHGYPREEVVRMKQKRRTLKNRGYAQNCRTKRLAQRHELESRNRLLQGEMARLRQELDRACRERDFYRQQLHALRDPRSLSSVSSGGAASNPSSPEFYL